MYRGERTYAEVVAEKGTRNGAGMPVGKWARAVVCEGKGKYETGVRKAQWFQERGSFTVRGEVFALRRWSPKRTQWGGRVTKVARNSLKFVDLSKVTLRVEMLPKVVLPALLEVEDGDWTYTVAVTVTGEDDGETTEEDSLRPLTAKMDAPSSFHFSSSDSKSAKGEKGKGRPGLSAKNKASEGLLQVSSKTKGSPVSVRRRARSGPPRFDEASSSPKRFEGGGSLETNRDISRGKSHSRKSDFSTGLETSKVYRRAEGEEGILQCKLINEVHTPFSAVSERVLPLSGAFEPNLIPETSVSLVHPFAVTLSSSFPLDSSYAFQSGSVFISPMVNDNLRGGASCSA
ncbi:hypothetical protein CK203_054062 [Vitis vinifera]|uniref:DUF4283 domain-containing protein n=1 Tax=Vitis vinifera TaxID=29760 RepID=A0A438GIP0_VITVI|nr:hypothetical protein CK203_054062 [Vitis vinifera]